MESGLLLKRLNRVLMSVCVLLTLFMTLTASHPTHLQADSPMVDRSSRVERSLTDNATTTSPPSCSVQLVSANETVDKLVDIITNNYFLILRIDLIYPTDGSTGDSAKNVIHPNLWHWVTGKRGMSLLTFPYDFESLSLGALQHGIHEMTITFIDNDSQNSSDTICVVRALFKLVGQVRQKLEESGGSLPDRADDLICREVSLTPPFFRGTQIPGYSVFELQASSYYDCYGYVNETYFSWPDSEIYSCYIVPVLFVVTYAVLFIVLFYKVWCIYAYSGDILDGDDTDNEDGENADPGADDDITDEPVNILRIKLIPPVLLVLAMNKRKHEKYFNLIYWGLMYLLPFLVYNIAFLVYVTRIDEFQYRSSLLGSSFNVVSVWILDFLLANAMYVAGAALFLYFVYNNNLDDPEAEPYQFIGKMKKMKFYFLVVALCFFRFSATVMLLLEVLSLTVVGIAINIKYVGPAWINVAAGWLVFIISVVAFFDSYQHLFNKIYSVGTKIDRENLPHKIFKQPDNSQPQTKFEISSCLLQDIIRKRLPLHLHFLNTVMHLIVAFAFLAIVAVIIIVIDRNTDISVIVEYLFTAGSLIAVGAGRIKGNPCSASGKEKNRSQDNLYNLEDDLREYARTGNYTSPVFV